MSGNAARKRENRRSRRGRLVGLAWVFLASPALIAVFGDGRYSVGEALVMPVIGVLMLVWFRRHPIEPEHLASVDLVRPTDYEGPDALTEAFYLAWCDCGWNGDEQPDEQSARAEALGHTSRVRSGLHAFGE